MDENIIRILASYGCKYMADDNKEMIEEIEAYVKKREQQLHIPDVVKSLPSKETIISEAIKYQDEFLDDPHSIADEAFIEGCNFILTALREDKIVR
jgi:hypothetical protein